jgi:serine protease AprX
MKLERKWVEELIFGTERLRRFLQDSPVLPDVWLGYAKDLDDQLDLLLTPFLGVTPGELSQNLQKRLSEERQTPRWRERHANVTGPKASPRIAYNQANVVVRLWFDELIRVVLPLAPWYRELVGESGLQQMLADLSACKDGDLKEIFQHPERAKNVKPALIWLIRLIGSFELALKKPPKDDETWEKNQEDLKGMVQAFTALMIDQKKEPAIPDKPLLWSVSRNRELFMSVSRSVPAIKADAAFKLFNISCQEVSWAIIDTGIDAKHEAFLRPKSDSGDDQKEEDWGERTRVEATYDFTLVRHLLSSDPASDEEIPKALRERLEENPGDAQELRQSINTGREIDWTLLEPFIAVPHDDKYDASQIPAHGTHVAGILGANLEGPKKLKGVCPDIKLYDLRVFDEEGVGDEFSVIAALQFIRHLNAHKDFLLVKGVNLSLSIHHDVANFACGRTPVCEECERLVGAGVVVVAAAGNQGYLQYMTAKGFEEGYRSISITDPGNTEGVITVGATHSFMPHTYGVSYFSSRGPTADGRCKPDLVAPGEKVESTVPGSGNYKVMDGTSMAAPHVSGAAALLIARHPELAGQPRRIKQIICDTATDLGRERYFQGAGMVDVLRALQSV